VLLERHLTAISADKQGCFPRTESLLDAHSLSGKETKPYDAELTLY
jgi:hypothetical protein